MSAPNGKWTCSCGGAGHTPGTIEHASGCHVGETLANGFRVARAFGLRVGLRVELDETATAAYRDLALLAKDDAPPVDS